MSNQLEKVKEIIELRAQARLGGGEKAIEKQHAKGKYTARERIAPVSYTHLDVYKRQVVNICIMLQQNNRLSC